MLRFFGKQTDIKEKAGLIIDKRFDIDNYYIGDYMEKKKCILLWDLIFAAAFAAICLVLWLFSLRLRQWLVFAAVAVIATGFVVGMLQMIGNAKDKWKKFVLSLFLALIVIGAAGAAYMVWSIVVPEEHIICTEDGAKYICNQTSFMFSYDGKIYDYKNALVFGRKQVDSYSYEKMDPFYRLDYAGEYDYTISLVGNSGNEYSILK